MKLQILLYQAMDFPFFEKHKNLQEGGSQLWIMVEVFDQGSDLHSVTKLTPQYCISGCIYSHVANVTMMAKTTINKTGDKAY